MSLKMRGEVLDEVVKRLRSGEYKQGKEKLAIKDDEGERYCCLGVVCEVAVQEGVITREEYTEEYWDYDTDNVGNFVERISVQYGASGNVSYDSTLPPEVAIWAGLITPKEWSRLSGSAFDDGPGMGRFAPVSATNMPATNTLAGMNDDGVPFSDIADWMEANVERV